jgi:hypothetical protein
VHGADARCERVRLAECGRGRLAIALPEQRLCTADPGVRREVRLGGGVGGLGEGQPGGTGVVSRRAGGLAPGKRLRSR